MEGAIDSTCVDYQKKKYLLLPAKRVFLAKMVINWMEFFVNVPIWMDATMHAEHATIQIL